MPKIIRVINGKVYSFDLKENKVYEEYAKQDLHDLLQEVENAIIGFLTTFGEPTEAQIEGLALQRLPQGVVDRLQCDLSVDETGTIVPEGTLLSVVEGEEEKVLELMIDRLIKLGEEQDE